MEEASRSLGKRIVLSTPLVGGQFATGTDVLTNVGNRQLVGKVNVTTFPRGDFAIPPRDMANELLNCYWTHVHMLYPYLETAAFNRRFERLWSVNRDETAQANGLLTSFDAEENIYSDDAVFFCILNLTFALGCQFSPLINAHDRCATGDVFFRRAEKFVNLDSLGHGDHTLVQALLLMAMFLQSTDMSEKCWNITGVAIRVAQSIGLCINLEADDEKYQGQAHCELRKRLWGGCILQDR